VLESYGYQVLEASNGKEALEVAGRHAGNIAVAVTDVVMPGISSRELTERLRAARPDIKILYVSGYPANTSIENDLMRSGASYLAKPYSPEALVSKLRELLSDSGTSSRGMLA
jgi:two-component system, cell cycle sensor histidine kinase and response regulator CckA